MKIHTVKIDHDIITQQQFDRAVDVLNCCYEEKTNYGLVKPYFKPGACPIDKNDYGDMWWSLDYALAVDGAKWLDFSIGEDFIENLYAVQEADGRIKLYSADVFFACHGSFKEKIGSLPKLMQTLYAVALKTDKPELKEKAYTVLSKNLAWWYRSRQDQETKLISAVFEETFVPNTQSGAFVYCPMDTNIEIYLGSRNAGRLARLLNKETEAAYFEGKATEILYAVRDYLWDEEDGVYYPYILPQKKRYKVKLASCFLGLYVGDAERNQKLIQLLQDDSEFGYDTVPVTTVSKKDPLFTVTDGDYKGNPSWLGSVWTLTNYAVIKALKDNGYEAIAGELTRKTLRIFQDNYAEFVNPATGKGNGMLKYAWTAAQFIALVLEE